MAIVKTEPNDEFFRTIQLTYAPKTENDEVKIEENNPSGISDVDISETLRPSKRIRTLEGVFVPRFEDILKKDEIAKDVGDRLKIFKNPKFKLKKKEEDFCLSDQVLYSRLKDIQLDLYPISLEPSILHSTVTRQFMCHQYGGSNAACFPNISQERVEKHGYNDFMYLNLNLNPHAPQVPGAPGLYFNATARPLIADDDEDDKVDNWPDLQRVYVRLEGGVWLKVGIYKMTRSKPLSKEEMGRDDMAKMRATWGREMATSKWGKSMRCSIKLRAELGREPTTEEFEEAMKRNDLFEDVSSEDVSRAFLLGEEVISVWKMQCVGYDVEFQKTTAAAFANWTPPPKRVRSKAKTTKDEEKADSSSTKTKKKVSQKEN
ncbi:hypothetical protein K435DRAFT_845899 [Dendrothele bispora CBS 962.96]|uniref:DUF6697 domain-containing protein n=1 Tax=Dendrothele bispora (strain CBS 962.96) TaxID=1314807 RepID=A0A4S8KQX1_DENBC|nr:hypothetical protein K435DRAFT_845899 [Dendrothele bispora CBS 962.96]